MIDGVSTACYRHRWISVSDHSDLFSLRVLALWDQSFICCFVFIVLNSDIYFNTAELTLYYLFIKMCSGTWNLHWSSVGPVFLNVCFISTKSFLKVFIWIFIVTMFNKSVKCFQSKMSVTRKKSPSAVTCMEALFCREKFFFNVIMKTKLF